MAKSIAEKCKTMQDALETLRDGIELYDEQKTGAKGSHAYRCKIAMRDSMIQRFEYCSDLFWKLLKAYTEEFEKITPEANSPRLAIRESVVAKLISEMEGQEAMDMIGKRNQTSHIYHQDIAQEIASHVPEYYRFIKTIVDRIIQKIK